MPDGMRPAAMPDREREPLTGRKEGRLMLLDTMGQGIQRDHREMSGCLWFLGILFACG